MQINKNTLLLGFGVISAFYFMPLVGFMLFLIFLHWKLKELMWRLQLGIMVLMTLSFVWLYLSHGTDAFIGWLLK